MSKKHYIMNQYTQYAHNYLSGYNDIPIGVLDNEEFKQEIIRLSGYTQRTKEEIISHNKRVNRDIKTIQNMVKSLLGPKGGKPKSGKALSDYKNLVHNLNILQANIW